MPDPVRPFEPLARTTLSEQVGAQLEARILAGDLPVGSQMPAERVLSAQFEVARTSVREAMQSLITKGLVERRGNRSYVVEHLPSVSVEPDDRKAFVRQLFETRRVVEVPLNELAAERATDEQRAAIRECADRFVGPLSLADFRRLDRQFHTTVAVACGNPLLVEVHGKLLDALFKSDSFESLLYATVNQPEVSAIVAQSCRDHVQIAAAVAAGDSVRTVEATEVHLANVEQRMLHDLV